jgi:phage-related holin
VGRDLLRRIVFKHLQMREAFMFIREVLASLIAVLFLVHVDFVLKTLS